MKYVFYCGFGENWKDLIKIYNNKIKLWDNRSFETKYFNLTSISNINKNY